MLLPFVFFALLTTPDSGNVPVPRVDRAALGRVAGHTITAHALFARDRRWADGRLGTWSVEFRVTQGNVRPRRLRFEVGEGSRDEHPMQAFDIAGLGRRQVCVSVKMGGIASFVLDCDGRHIRQLYERTDGRVGVSIVRTPQGRWRLQEWWPLSQWGDDLGTGYEVAGANSVVRLLHWNGKRFVPDEPAPSRIVSAEARPAPVYDFCRPDRAGVAVTGKPHLLLTLEPILLAHGTVRVVAQISNLEGEPALVPPVDASSCRISFCDKQMRRYRPYHELLVEAPKLAPADAVKLYAGHTLSASFELTGFWHRVPMDGRVWCTAELMWHIVRANGEVEFCSLESRPVQIPSPPAPQLR